MFVRHLNALSPNTSLHEQLRNFVKLIFLLGERHFYGIAAMTSHLDLAPHSLIGFLQRIAVLCPREGYLWCCPIARAVLMLGLVHDHGHDRLDTFNNRLIYIYFHEAHYYIVTFNKKNRSPQERFEANP